MRMTTSLLCPISFLFKVHVPFCRSFPDVAGFPATAEVTCVVQNTHIHSHTPHKNKYKKKILLFSCFFLSSLKLRFFAG